MHIPKEFQHLVRGHPREGLFQARDKGVTGRDGKGFQGRNHLLVQRPVQTRTEPWGDGRVHARLQNGERAGAEVRRLLLANAAGSAAEAAETIINQAREIPGLIMGGAEPTLLRRAGGRRFTDGGRSRSLRVRRRGRLGQPVRRGRGASHVRVLGTRSGRPPVPTLARLRDRMRLPRPRLIVGRFPLDLNFETRGSLFLCRWRRGAGARAGGGPPRSARGVILAVPIVRTRGRLRARGLGGRRAAGALPASGGPASAPGVRTTPGAGTPRGLGGL